MANDKSLESLNVKLETLSSTLKNQLSFNKMIETQLAQIAAALPAVESGKIQGQPETPVENVSMVSTRWDNSSRRTPRTNHAGRYNPPRNDVWDGMVAAVQEDPWGPHDQLLNLHQTLRVMPMRSGGKHDYNAQGNI